MDTTVSSGDEEESPWDDVDQVDHEFVKTGKSKGLGVLTTHDNHFKVLFSCELITIITVIFPVPEKSDKQGWWRYLLRL